MMANGSRRGAGGQACGRAVCGQSHGGASVTGSLDGTSTSGTMPLVHSSLSSGPSLLSAPAASSFGASDCPAVVGDLLVTDLLQMICDKVRQSSLTLSLPSLMLPVIPSVAPTSITGLRYQGSFAPSELLVNVGGSYGVCH